MSILNFNQFLHLNNVYRRIRVRRDPTYKKRNNHFKLSDDEFKRRYRLSKITAKFVISLVRRDIEPKMKRKFALSPSDMVLLTLRFFASGNFLLTVADYCGVSVSTACRVVKSVSLSIAKLSNKFIFMPCSEYELQKTASEFYDIAKFPKVLGTIDCTHIRIQSPGGHEAEVFRNRKGFFSFNVQAICNANLVVTDIVARWPGSAHDSNIFNNSRIKARLEDGEFGDYWLLGDSGYGVKPYLLTPLNNPKNEAESLYNESQIRTRNVVERCFGVCKRRFPILSLGIRLSTNTTMTVIVACVVLHNICRLRKDPEPFDTEFVEYPDEPDFAATNSACVNSNTINNLVNNYFAKL